MDRSRLSLSHYCVLVGTKTVGGHSESAYANWVVKSPYLGFAGAQAVARDMLIATFSSCDVRKVNILRWRGQFERIGFPPPVLTKLEETFLCHKTAEHIQGEPAAKPPVHPETRCDLHFNNEMEKHLLGIKESSGQLNCHDEIFAQENEIFIRQKYASRYHESVWVKEIKYRFNGMFLAPTSGWSAAAYSDPSAGRGKEESLGRIFYQNLFGIKLCVLNK